MFIERHDDGYTRFYFDEPLPDDFAARLLTELYALSKPMRAGLLGAHASREKSVDDIVAEGLRKSRVDIGGATHRNGSYYFEYVGGHRIKVDFHPNGHLDQWGEPTALDRGRLPVVVQRDYDEMYGQGTTEAAIKLALMP